MLWECVIACGGGTTCVNQCEQSFPTAQSTYQLLSTCAQTPGSPCTESGTGDPCGSFGYPCAINLTCNGQWCTRTCSQDSDCTGIGPGGNNNVGLGQPNRCVRLTGGATTCEPGCMGVQDCSVAFPGTTCVTATDASGSPTFVCGALGDAATE
jgi:hypothetical protein